jgi:outer membrane lipoprotein-sorting protein
MVAQQEDTPDKKAASILQSLNKKAKTYKTIKASFSLVSYGRDKKQGDKQEGTLLVKGGKYRLELKSQTIYCDSLTLWTYITDANEVQINTIDRNNDKETLSPATIFNLYEKDFKSRYDTEKSVAGKIIVQIDLYPRHPEKEKYHTLKLFIDKSKNQVTDIKVMMKDATEMDYSITDFSTNIQLPDTEFIFNTKDHPGVEVEDLRE